MSAGIWLIAAVVLVVLPTAARSEIEERKHCQTARCLPTCFRGIGPDGCPSCDCPPTCQDHPCPDDEECIMQEVRCKNKRKHCFPRPTCVPKDVTTTVGPMSTVCPSISCGDPPFCYLDYPPGEKCPVCLCFDPACKLMGCPPGQNCLPTGECPTCYECLPEFVTTLAPTVTVAWPSTSGPNPNCPISDCNDPPFCSWHYSPGEECPTCLCFDPKCLFEGCLPGQQCLPTGECDTCYDCLPKFVSSTESPTNTPIPRAADIPKTTTTSECPIPPCAVGCHQVPGSDGCPICDCSTNTCQEVSCDPGQECVMQCPSDTTQCFPQPTCVPVGSTTTSSTTG